MTQGSGGVNSVHKAMELIERLLAFRRPMSLTELAAAAGFPKSTAYALLSTLREHGMIEQNTDGKYYLGMRLFECGCALSASWDISAAARPHLETLAYTADASAFISAIVKYDVIVLDQCSGNSGLRIVSDVGSKSPLHCTSQGKMLLSQFGDIEVGAVLASTGMRAYTPHTITDKSAFMAELEKIRAQKYAVEDGEYKIGLRSVSAPVYDNTGRMRYALSVLGLFRRVDTEDFRAALENVCAAAAELSEELGYRL